MRYVMRKVGLFIVTLWAAITLNFLLPRLMPGSPVDAALGKLASAGVPITNAERQAVEIQLGVPNASLISQYGDYLRNIATLRFGTSYSFPTQTVAQTIGTALPWTLILVGVTTIVAFAVGTLLGVYAGWRRGRLADSTVTLGSTFFGSFPPFRRVLPAVTLAVTTLSGWVLGMRNNMINTLGEDYVTFAEANGLRDRTVAMLYAARNALLPNVTAFGLQLGAVVSGSVLVEGVFSYPGIGGLLFTSVTNHDFPLMQALFLVITLSMLVAIFIVDLLYVRLDPRVRR